ncbi:cytochrome P450 315a1, mitochondrial isoform X2 [Topomyia yanbarensis]|uniref:cytochrome P450 315a1, mitochondrial isoform X2 n=1 Tax=Topomyia yanbarensis TaxID=2498891 RepID=UPI00273C2FBF|nr:cytochrome P450 315a1, mitochondrial isoform X2 [Topomyia yanbarensis]
MSHAAKILRSHVKPLASVTKLKALPFERLPGPLRISFLGPLNEAIQLGNPKTLHLKISNYHEKYGPMFKVKLSKVDAVFINNPEMMRTVFDYEGKYPKHPLPETWRYFNRKHNCKRGLFFMDNEEWFQYRKFLNQHLMRDVKWMEGPVKWICDRTVDNLPKHCESIVEDYRLFEISDIESILYKWSIEVILGIMLGNSYNDKSAMRLNDLVDKFSNIVYQIFQHSSNLMTIPPYLADRLKLDAWKKFEMIVPETLSIANQIIDTSLDDFEQGDGLLSKLQDSITSRDDIKRIFADFIIAAGDTTSFGTLWCLYLLAKYPSMQEQVYVSITGNDLESPLVRGTIKEALRLFPVAPFIGRILEKDAIIGSYCIPKNTLALLSLYTAGRDAANFYRPEDFLPHRWIRENDNSMPFSPFHANASLPFAIGSRSCIGRRIALYQMQFLLSKIMKKYRITVDNDTYIEAELNLVTVPKSKFKIVFERRE